MENINREIDYNKKYKRKELCKMIGITYDSKHSDRCLEEIKRIFELEKITAQQFRIIREFSEDEKIEKWKRTEYKKLFKDITYTVLACSDKNTIRQSDDEYMLLFHMVNENFKMFTQNYLNDRRSRLLSVHNKDSYFEIDAMKFANEVRQMLKRVLASTFNQMEEENLITIKKHIVFGIPISFKDENGRYVTYSKKVDATNDEIELLMETETKVLHENGYELDRIKDIKDYLERRSLRSKVSKRLKISYYTTENELVLNRYGLNYKVEHNLELSNLKKHLNKGTINKILNSKQGKLKEIEKYKKEEIAQLLIEIKD